MKAVKTQLDENRSIYKILNASETKALRIYRTGDLVTYATIGRLRLDVWEATPVEEAEIDREEISYLFRALAFNLIDKTTTYQIHEGTPIRADHYEREVEEAPAIFNYITEGAAIQLNERDGRALIMTAPGGRVYQDLGAVKEWFSVGQNYGQKRYIDRAKSRDYVSKIMLYPAIHNNFVSTAEYERLANIAIDQSLDLFFE